MGRSASLKSKLEKAFSPQSLEIVNESHLHAGHQEHFDGTGETHLRIRIVAPAFEGMNRIDRHRETGELRVIDYKTGAAKGAAEAHRSKLTAASKELAHLPVVGGHPVLEELVRAGANRVQPDPSAGRLAELRAVWRGQERPGEAPCRPTVHPSDQVDATEHVPPLVRTADLHLDVLERPS